MGTQSTVGKKKSARVGKRRRYESSQRQAQVAETRARILVAGSKLAHRAKNWEWSEITADAVAAEAGVSDRTVYRHFATQRQLHDALMRHLEGEAGVFYEGIELNELGAVTERVFASLPSFAVPPTVVVRDATFAASDQRRREALLQAIGEFTATWSETERRMAAAMLDVLWTPTSYERLVTRWGFDTAAAARAVTMTIDVLTEAIRGGRRPWREVEPSQTRKRRSRSL